MLEDELRRDGTITIKQPDVWGDGNLIYFIQEHERELAGTVGKFKETVQAYVARGDQAEMQSVTALSQGLGGTSPPSLVTPAADGKTAPLTVSPINLETKDLFDLIEKIRGKDGAKVGLEPIESERQHSTYILANQSLRRRVSGDDNSRAAGYGLYKFRIPVSILPGRETTEGWSGLVSLRARLEVDAANLRYTFPKLVVADVVDTLTPRIEAEWNKPIKSDVANLTSSLRRKVSDLRTLVNPKLDNCDLLVEIENAHIALNLTGELKQEQMFNARTSLQSALCKLPARRSDPGNEEVKHRDRLVLALIDCLKHSEQLAPMLNKGDEKSNDGFRLNGAAVAPPITHSARGSFLGESIDSLRVAAQEHFQQLHDEKHKPSTLELRAFLFEYLAQVQIIVEKRDLYQSQIELLDKAVEQFEKGAPIASSEGGKRDFRAEWIASFNQQESADANVASVSWIVGLQSAIVDRNMKRILESISRQSGESIDPAGLAKMVHFYAPDVMPVETLEAWRKIVNEQFPLYVFSLDPQIEEQNAVDAFSRRREIQLALAYGLATGEINAQKSLALSRQLSLDQEAIALNRTVVGFNHGRDTFGWYFHPRIQSPPTESTNIGAFARLVWSTGPTDHYDYKHRRLEPGIRECEVLVAMPSFVGQVAFDVTSNWERIPRPGKTKRSYEEMVAQGGRLHRVQMNLRELADEHCFRPGDSARLVSRVEQLEQMLGMQTYNVRVPYEYEQSGTDLFDKGNVQLRPVVHNFYGLRYVKAGDNLEAHFFVSGKNFHPTLTHVILGGRESHSIGADGSTKNADVEVVSREVLKVKIANVNADHSQASGFDLRIATPGGISNVVEVPKTPVKEAASPSKSDFDFVTSTSFPMRVTFDNVRVEADIEDQTDTLLIINQSDQPVARKHDGKLQINLVIKDSKGQETPLPPIEDVRADNLGDGRFQVKWKGKKGLREKLIESITDPNTGVKPSQDLAEIVGTVYIKFDVWPYVKLDTPIKLTQQPTRLPTP